MIKKTIKTPYFAIYGFILILLTIAVYNYSPNPTDGVTDDKLYYQQALTLKEYGLFGGFKVLTKEYLKQNNQVAKDTKKTDKGNTHPLRVGRVVLHYIGLSIFNNGIRSGMYLSIIFYFLLGLLIFYFTSRYWPPLQTLMVSILVMTSPLLMGYSARAVMESQHYFFMLLNLFLFIEVVHRPNQRNIKYLIVAIVLNITFKETAGLFVPFFIIGLLAAKYFYNKSITYRQINLVLLAPIAILLVLYFLFIGLQDLFSILLDQTNRHILADPLALQKAYKSGPWYQYLVDFMVLSPILSLMTLMIMGYFLVNSQKYIENKSAEKINTLIFIAFFVYTIVIFSFLLKHVRYVIFLEYVYSFLAISALYLGVQKWKDFLSSKQANYITIGIFVLLIGFNLNNYHTFFVKEKLLKVWNKNLVVTSGFFKAAIPKRAFRKRLFRPILEKAKENLAAKNYKLAIAYADAAIRNRPKPFDKNDPLPDYIKCHSYHQIGKRGLAKQSCRSFFGRLKKNKERYESPFWSRKRKAAKRILYGKASKKAAMPSDTLARTKTPTIDTLNQNYTNPNEE